MPLVPNYEMGDRDHMKVHSHHTADMLSVEQAYERILSFFAPLRPEEKPILETLGQVLSKDIFCPFDIPQFFNSAMDGYAVRYDDTKNATSSDPAILKVIDVLPAGELPRKNVAMGTAIRIMTGAMVPDGANTVVPFEDTDELERNSPSMGLIKEIGIRVAHSRGSYVRPAGEDVEKGALVLRKGTVIRPSEVGVLASLGLSKVDVISRPSVSILATGNELALPGDKLVGAQIYDSNSFGVAASVLRYGGIPKILGIAKDNLEDLSKKLDECLDADMIITSAGVSKGDYDVVKDVLMKRGEINFWSVRMRPAKPIAWGILLGNRGNQIPHLGLPGNPVSAMVAFEEFARPAILTMLGKTNLDKPFLYAVLQAPIYNNDGRRVFARVYVSKSNGSYIATPTGPQGSNILTSMSRANGLAICPEDCVSVDAGETVRVKMLDWDE